jgi:hypothetical protein
MITTAFVVGVLMMAVHSPAANRLVATINGGATSTTDPLSIGLNDYIVPRMDDAITTLKEVLESARTYRREGIASTGADPMVSSTSTALLAIGWVFATLVAWWTIGATPSSVNKPTKVNADQATAAQPIYQFDALSEGYSTAAGAAAGVYLVAAEKMLEDAAAKEASDEGERADRSAVLDGDVRVDDHDEVSVCDQSDLDDRDAETDLKPVEVFSSLRTPSPASSTSPSSPSGGGNATSSMPRQSHTSPMKNIKRRPLPSPLGQTSVSATKDKHFHQQKIRPFSTDGRFAKMGAVMSQVLNGSSSGVVGFKPRQARERSQSDTGEDHTNTGEDHTTHASPSPSVRPFSTDGRFAKIGAAMSQVLNGSSSGVVGFKPRHRRQRSQSDSGEHVAATTPRIRPFSNEGRFAKMGAAMSQVLNGSSSGVVGFKPRHRRQRSQSNSDVTTPSSSAAGASASEARPASTEGRFTKMSAAMTKALQTRLRRDPTWYPGRGKQRAMDMVNGRTSGVADVLADFAPTTNRDPTWYPGRGKQRAMDIFNGRTAGVAEVLADFNPKY